MVVSDGSCADLLAALEDRSSVLRLRVRGEYHEMPGLCLFVDQAARLFGLHPTEAQALLESLVAEGYLRSTPRGFVRSGNH